MIKKCSKCKKEKNIENFNFKSKKLDLRHAQCKECSRFLIKNHYNKNRQYYLAKAQKRNNKLRLEILKFLNEYLSKNPCVDCGERDITVLEFDHKGEIPKFKAVSTLVRDRSSLEEIQYEIDKCEVRCANCHRRKTAGEFGWFKSNMHPW